MLTKKNKKKRYNKISISNQDPHFKDHLFKYESGGILSGVTGVVTGALNTGINTSQLQGVDEAEALIANQENFQSTALDQKSLLAEMATSTDVKTNYTKSDFLPSDGSFGKNLISGTLSGAASGAAAGPWGALAGGVASLVGGLVGRAVAARKAKSAAKDLNAKAIAANNQKANTLISKAGALDQAEDQRTLAAYAAYGGGINTPKFPDFPSEVTEFNTGGSHEANPYDGIPQGLAPDGLPNLVEEGEVKYDNYIFSDRLMLNKNDKKKYKFLKGKTYADAAKAIKKELGIDERPNDLIAKTDLEEQLNLLSMLQEEKRAKRGLKGENRMMYKNGGHIFRGDRQEIRDYIDAGFSRREARNLASGNFSELLDAPVVLPPIRRANTDNFDGSSLLQAAPAIGSAIGTITSIFDKPTYEHTKRLTQPEKPVTPITYTPTHQDIRLDRFDTNYHANKLAAQAGATRRAIREQTASNPYASTAALLSADANTQSQMGDLYRKAAEYNQGVALQEAQFNEAGRRADAEGLLKAASANATLQDKTLSRQAEKDAMVARVNMAEDQAYDAAVSANMTGLFDNLGAMGKEDREFALAAMKMMGEGKLTPEMQAIMLPQLQKILAKSGYKNGGKLRKKKGYTI